MTDDILTSVELTESLAEAEGITPDELDAAAEGFEIAPPWDAKVIRDE